MKLVTFQKKGTQKEEVGLFISEGIVPVSAAGLNHDSMNDLIRFMTEEEKEELNCLCYHNIGVQDNMLQGYLCGSEINDVIDWLISHRFDYRTDDEGKTMIENGLAIEVTENNNPYK